MANVIKPVVGSAGNEFPFRVLPRQRGRTRDSSKGPDVVKDEVYACKNEKDQGLVTLDRSLHVWVRELIYPGRDSAAISDKWIYVLRGKTYIAEIRALNEKSWQVLPKPNPDTPNSQRCMKQTFGGFIPLDPGPEGGEYTYEFFLSPIRLTPNALKFLQNNTQESCVSQKFKRTVAAVVEVPDPFHWSADAHRKYYLPSLHQWEQWISKPDLQARVFIAGVLQALLKDDKTKIAGKLKDGEPAAWLRFYKQVELEFRKAADNAMVYVAHCVDSVEHHAVEIGGMDAGCDALACCYLQWAAVSGCAMQVLPGRQFVANAVGNPDRLPAKFLFSDSPPSQQLNFEDYRYAWLAALTAFENLVPEKFREFRVKKIKPLDRIKHYLEGLGVKTRNEKLTGKQKTIAQNIEKGRPLSKGFGSGTGAQRRFREYYNGLLMDATLSSIEKAEKKAEKFSKFIDKIHTEYKGTILGAKLMLGTLIEIINVSNAVNEYIEATGDEKGLRLFGTSKARNVVGTIGDLTVHVAGLTEEAFEQQLGTGAKSFLRGIGGLAGFISGTVDMLNFEEGMVKDGLAKNDYAVQAGKAISALGSAGIAVMGGLALAGAIFPASLPSFAAMGPVGWIAGAIFGVLVIGGCLIAALLSDNPYQQFAGTCCFGKSHGKETCYFPWAPHGMGQGTPVREAENLLCLLSAFQLKAGAGSVYEEDLRVEITPGFIDDNCIFEVKVVNRWNNIQSGNPLCYSIEVHFHPDTVRQLDGPYDLYAKSSVSRNKEGNVDLICIHTAEIYPGEYGKGSRKGHTVSVRLRNPGTSFCHPKNMKWVKIDLLRDSEIHSLGETKSAETADAAQANADLVETTA